MTALKIKFDLPRIMLLLRKRGSQAFPDVAVLLCKYVPYASDKFPGVLHAFDRRRRREQSGVLTSLSVPCMFTNLQYLTVYSGVKSVHLITICTNYLSYVALMLVLAYRLVHAVLRTSIPFFGAGVIANKTHIYTVRSY
jgi:hypothetical protein